MATIARLLSSTRQGRSLKLCEDRSFQTRAHGWRTTWPSRQSGMSRSHCVERAVINMSSPQMGKVLRSSTGSISRGRLEPAFRDDARGKSSRTSRFCVGLPRSTFEGRRRSRPWLLSTWRFSRSFRCRPHRLVLSRHTAPHTSIARQRVGTQSSCKTDAYRCPGLSIGL